MNACSVGTHCPSLPGRYCQTGGGRRGSDGRGWSPDTLGVTNRWIECIQLIWKGEGERGKRGRGKTSVVNSWRKTGVRKSPEATDLFRVWNIVPYATIELLRSLCLSVCLSACVALFTSICLYVCVYRYNSVCLCLSVSLSVSGCLSISWAIYMFACLHFYVCLCLSVSIIACVCLSFYFLASLVVCLHLSF